MSDELNPALTPDEWAYVTGESETTVESNEGLGEIDLGGDCWWQREDHVRLGAGAIERDLRRPHALAALCLHGQPYGFTWEDVDELRNEAKRGEYAERTGDNSGYSAIDPGHARELADRIAALLPPRVP